LALEEFVEFERAIQEAVSMTNDDTLIIVTSDHAHRYVILAINLMTLTDIPP